MLYLPFFIALAISEARANCVKFNPTNITYVKMARAKNGLNISLWDTPSE